jgi:hypothetical protein
MTSPFTARRVTAPSGTKWRVGRRWFSPRQRPQLRGIAGAGNGFDGIPDLGGIDDIGTLIITAVAFVVIVLVLIPLLLFGLELVIVGLLAAAGVISRFLLGRPWLVTAIPGPGDESPRAWEVKDWRRSGRVVAEVAGALASGDEPSPTEPVTEVLATPTRLGAG